MTNKCSVDDKMVFEINRLKTFINWPFGESAVCTASKMAEAGFYSCGGPTEPDAVACFLCGKELDGWEESDDPWEEHRQHAKQCMFVQVGKPEIDMTANEFFGICQQFNINSLNMGEAEIMVNFEKNVKTATSNIMASKLSY